MDQEIIQLTQDLVKQNTTAGNSMNAAPILYDFLEEHGLNATLDEYKEDDANVYTQIGPENAPAFVISGHIDTVPIGDPEAWNHDPYSAKIVDGELWGRGSVDMKGGLATLAGVMVELLEHEDELQHRVFFAGTAEEETGLIGAKQYQDKDIIGDISHVLIAEPTNLVPNTMEKGILWTEIKATGKQAHGSRPELGHNAIEGLSELLPQLYAALPDTSVSGLGKTTLNVGLIEGGSAANVVPQQAKTTIDIRTTPGVTNEEVINNLRSIVKDASDDVRFELNVLQDFPSILSSDNEFAELLAEKTAAHTGTKPKLGGVHYATDGALFMEYAGMDVPFVIYGPGSTELLHQTNERLEVSQLKIAKNTIREAILTTLT